MGNVFILAPRLSDIPFVIYQPSTPIGAFNKKGRLFDAGASPQLRVVYINRVQSLEHEPDGHQFSYRKALGRLDECVFESGKSS